MENFRKNEFLIWYFLVNIKYFNIITTCWYSYCLDIIGINGGMLLMVEEKNRDILDVTAYLDVKDNNFLKYYGYEK